MTKFQDEWKKRQEESAHWHPFDSLLGRVRLILLVDWDPVGIVDIPGNSDEYDSYAVKVYKMLLAHASRDELIAYLDFKTGRKIRPYELSASAVADKLLFMSASIDETGEKQAARDASEIQAIENLRLQWLEICEYLPEQWVLMEAVETHSESEKLILDFLTVLDRFSDADQANQEHKRLARDFPEREFYVAHTEGKTQEITPGTWLGVRNGQNAD